MFHSISLVPFNLTAGLKPFFLHLKICLLISILNCSKKLSRSKKYHLVLLIRPYCTEPIWPRPAVFKQLAMQPTLAIAQVLKPLVRCGAKYKIAVIYLYFWPFIVFALLSIFNNFFDLYNFILKTILTITFI